MPSQMILSRRNFLLTAGAVTAGCLGSDIVTSAPVGTAARIRQPDVGQSWRYSRRDLVTGTTLDTEMDRVSATGQSIEIESHSETTKSKPVEYPSWDTPWLKQYTRPDRPAGSLPSEVQAPWGMVLVDPHWTQLQVYKQPIPLWPQELRPGWSTTVGTSYKVPDSDQIMPWQLTMSAHEWEPITVPAGRFTALRFTNLINFQFTNVSGRNAAQRKETIWFAPEIGRWVVRESSGSFRQDVAEEFFESSNRWELLSWT